MSFEWDDPVKLDRGPFLTDTDLNRRLIKQTKDWFEGVQKDRARGEELVTELKTHNLAVHLQAGPPVRIVFTVHDAEVVLCALNDLAARKATT